MMDRGQTCDKGDVIHSGDDLKIHAQPAKVVRVRGHARAAVAVHS